MENAFLKKAAAFFAKGQAVNDKYRLMYAEKENFPVKLMARILEVSRSGFMPGAIGQKDQKPHLN